jgi:hypothetical protein
MLSSDSDRNAFDELNDIAEEPIKVETPKSDFSTLTIWESQGEVY